MPGLHPGLSVQGLQFGILNRAGDVRTYRQYSFRDANFRICCDRFDVVTAEIVRQREILEEYIRHHPEFGKSLEPVDARSDAPEVAVRMASAARPVGVGPMAAVAGIMAELAGRAGMDAGADEVIVENGGDIYLSLALPATVALYAGQSGVGGKLAFSIPAEDTPIAVCSSSGKMGHSMSLGNCDLATVVAKDTALADAAATRAANLVRTVDDVDAALAEIDAIPGIDGVLIVKDSHVGLAGNLPELARVDS